MVSWELVYTKHAQKDTQKLSSAGLKERVLELLAVLQKNPFQNPPPYEKLIGDLSGAYSRRINIQHRLVYQLLEEQHVVKVLRMWSHYEIEPITGRPQVPDSLRQSSPYPQAIHPRSSQPLPHA